MSSSLGIKIVMGGTGLLRQKPAPEVPKLLSILQAHNISNIDTAITYGDSEEILGEHHAGDSFILDTKIPGGLQPGSAGKASVIQQGRQSLEKLKVKQVDILYIHSPDTSVPVENTLDGINELHKAGTFRRLGLSNFKPEQVEEVFEICEAKGYVKPSVYQGNYNAFARSYEETLLPLLRKRGMSFYAYSPQAGGFLSKTSDLLTGGQESQEGQGRFLSKGVIPDMYRALYRKPTLLKGLNKWNEIATDAGLHPGELAVRWVRFNSALLAELDDAMIIGGRTADQIESALHALQKGSLDQSVVDRIDEVWEMVKEEAPVDNYHDFLKEVLDEQQAGAPQK